MKYISLIVTFGIAINAMAQSWQTLTPLPDGYQEHCLVYANGFLYNIGGVSESNGDRSANDLSTIGGGHAARTRPALGSA